MRMIDREKVIKDNTVRGLQNAIEISGAMVHLQKEHAKAILELLKEQEAVKPIYNEERYGDHLSHCGNCEKVLPNNAEYGKVNFCHYCGKAVKRE